MFDMFFVTLPRKKQDNNYLFVRIHKLKQVIKLVSFKIMLYISLLTLKKADDTSVIYKFRYAFHSRFKMLRIY